MREVRQFLRSNPQVLVLLLICLVLGIGTFVAIMFGLVSSGSGGTTGEPSGSLGLLHAAASWTGVLHAAASWTGLLHAAASWIGVVRG